MSVFGPIEIPDRSVEPKDLRFVGQRIAMLADELEQDERDESVPYSYVLGQVIAALGSLDAPGVPWRGRRLAVVPPEDLS